MPRFAGRRSLARKHTIAVAVLLAAAGSFGGRESQPFVVGEQPAPQAVPPIAVLAETLRAAPQAEPVVQSLEPAEVARVKSNGDLFTGNAKPGGKRFTVSAARYADVKRDVHIPRTAAKRADDEPFADPDLPRWLRLSTPEAVNASLEAIAEVGLPPKTYAKNAVPVAIESPEDAGLPRLKNDVVRSRDKHTAQLGWTATTLRGMSLREPKDRIPLAVFFQGFGWAELHRLTVSVNAAAEAPTAAPAILDPADTIPSVVLPALTQILAVEDPQYRLEIIRRISAFPAGDDAAISVLVRMALFDADAGVRDAARLALVREPAARYESKLLEGLRYPLPVVAERAAQAIVALDRVALAPKLVELLDEPDPSAPQEREEQGRKIVTVREVVKINHSRNCTVCHPVTRAQITSTTMLIASVPSQDEALPSPLTREYYATGRDVKMVSATTTYVRQDFSLLQQVADHGPWPAMQRFDYVVRTRVLTEKEAKDAKKADAGDIPTVNRRAVLYALTRLTSLYPGSHADDWRPAIRSWLEATKKSVR